MTEKHIGMVIKKIKFQADDEIVTILTPNEILSFISLGTRKLKSKNRVALDYGNIISVEIFRARLNNKLSKLKRANLIKQPPVRISDTANVIISIVKYLAKLKGSSEELFKAILEAYPYLGDTNNHYVKTYILFKSFHALGIYPSTKQCVECGRPDGIIGFDYKDGGFKCSLHADRERDINELKAIQELDRGIKDYVKIDPAINTFLYNEIIYIINEYIWKEY